MTDIHPFLSDTHPPMHKRIGRFYLLIAFHFNSDVTTPPSLIAGAERIAGTVRVGVASCLEPLPYLPYLRP